MTLEGVFEVEEHDGMSVVTHSLRVDPGFRLGLLLRGPVEDTRAHARARRRPRRARRVRRGGWLTRRAQRPGAISLRMNSAARSRDQLPSDSRIEAYGNGVPHAIASSSGSKSERNAPPAGRARATGSARSPIRTRCSSTSCGNGAA